MINHGVSTGALFLLVGMIYERRKTRQIAELKGIQSVAPIFAAGFLVVVLSSIGVPGLNGFVGEFLILIGSFDTARWWTVVATAGVILAAVYLLWAYQRVFHGEPDEDNSTFAELKVKEAAVLLPFLAAIVFLGVYPKPVLDRIEPSIDRLMVHVADNSSYEPQVGRQRAEAPAHGSDEGEGGEGGDDSDEGTHSTDGPGGDGG
jgi:NADH-quinone oxidoreductase subunit M